MLLGLFGLKKIPSSLSGYQTHNRNVHSEGNTRSLVPLSSNNWQAVAVSYYEIEIDTEGTWLTLTLCVLHMAFEPAMMDLPGLRVHPLVTK